MAPDGKRASWPARLWSALRGWWDQPVKTTRGRVLIGAGFVLVGFTAAFWGLFATSNDLRERDLYRTRLAHHAIEVANIESCKAEIPRSEALRAQFVILAAHYDALAMVIDDPAARDILVQWSDDIHNGPYLALPPKTLSDCGEPGPEPEPPG